MEPTADQVNTADALMLVPVVWFTVPLELQRTPETLETFGAAYAVTDILTVAVADLPLESVILTVYVNVPETVITSDVALALALALCVE